MVRSNVKGTSSSRIRRLGPDNHSQARWPATSRFLWSYIPDWFLAFLFAALSYQLGKISGFEREFSLNDTSIQHTYSESEHVPRWALHMISLVAPALLMPVINLVSIQSLWDLHNSWLGLTLTLSLTGLITNLVKVSVGRPRPDLISRCLPYPGAKDKPIWGLSNYTICTQTDEHFLRDGFRSFPSGHASLAFAGLGYLSFYLAGKLHIWDEHGYTGKVWLTLIPLMGAALVAVSRAMDYRHHWHDIFAGSLLGLTVALFCYHQFFPSLTHTASHFPLPPRVDLPIHLSRDHPRAGQEEIEPLVRPDDEGDSQV